MQPTRRIRIDSYVPHYLLMEIMAKLQPAINDYIKTKADNSLVSKSSDQYSFNVSEVKVATFTIRHSKHFIIIEIFPI